ncbi:hypothetical protein AX14_013727 [Amanita brunnescens Koide BX004]|nr:hypothetical protein AX14_013727 [Amanita brunnescens Koide BX004]
MADLVTTTINYNVPPADGARAFRMIDDASERNFSYQTQEVQVENIRSKEDAVSLDTAGFQFYTISAKYKGEFLDDEEVKREYYPESEELLKKLTGASKVVIFNHTIRRNKPDQSDNGHNERAVQRAHVDQTTAASVACVQHHFPPDETQALLQHRFQIINLWRPMSVPALEFPVALCDFRSVDPKSDVFPAAIVFPDREHEMYFVKYNPNHKWKYVRGMTPDEFVLIKCFDSTQEGSVAKFTPHTAFQDPTTPEDAPYRQSIEVRALVFYE